MTRERDNFQDKEYVEKLIKSRNLTISDVDTVSLICQLYNCLTPEMFGAVGDGKSDDTESIREALYQSNAQSKALFFQSGRKYRITGSINYYDGKYRDYCLHMIGSIPLKKGGYSLSNYGGIEAVDGVSVFKNANITGSIRSMSFVGKRSEDVKLFDTCICSGIVITGCNISNFGTVFFDTRVNKLSQIVSNIFLTVFYFSRNYLTSSGLTDSTISYNYINGGIEKKDNACFEWGYYNGSLITNNFIDYYRTIYFPRAISKQAFVGPVSSNNHYQVFRYLYAAGPNINTISFYSFSDAFNWNDPSSKEVSFIPITYVGKDGLVYEKPPYIAVCKSSWQTFILGAKIESYVCSLVFVESSLTEYESNSFNVEFLGNSQFRDGQISYIEGNVRPIYNSGKYLYNKVSISGITEKVDKLPELSIGWSNRINGQRVLFDGTVYEATNLVENGQSKAVWKPVFCNCVE